MPAIPVNKVSFQNPSSTPTGGAVDASTIRFQGSPSYAPPVSDKRDALGAGMEAAATGLTQGLPYATMKALGIATPEDDKYYQQKFQESAQKQEAALPGGPKSIFSNNPLQGVGETLAYGAPQMASELGAGAVAGGVATLAAGPEAGAAAGMAATGAVAFPQYVGSNAISATDNGNQPLSQDAANRSFLAAGGQSVLDAGASALGAKALLGEGFTGNLLVRAGKGAAEGTVLGAGDQVARGVGTQYAAGKDLGSAESLQEDIEGAGVGGILGGALGGPLGVFKKAKPKGALPDNTDLLKPAGSGPDGTTSDATNPTKLLSGATYSPDELHPGYSPNPEVNNGLALAAPGAPPEPPTIFAENPTKKLTGPPDQPVTDPNQNNPSASPNPQGPPGLLAHGQVGRTDGVPDHFGGNGIAPANDLPPAAPQVLPTDEVKGLFTQTNIAAELRPQGETGYDPHMQAVTSALTKSLGENNPDGADAYIARKTKELKAQDGVEDPAILAKKQAILDKATQVVQAYREHMADAMQREEALTNPNIQTPPDTLHPAVASALANAPDHPKAATQPPVMVDPVQHAKMIRDAEKEALKAHEHEQALQDAMEKQRQRAADQAQKAQEAAHAQRMAMVEHSNRTKLIDAALNDPKINDPAGWVIAHLKRYNFDNKDLTPLERQRIAEHERNNLRLDGAEPMGNPKEGEDVPRAERAPESPDFANSDQTRMFDKNGKVLPKVRQEGPSNKDMETERAKAHTAAEAISNVRAEIEAKPDAPNSEVVDAIAHGIRQITDNVPAKDRLEALSVLKNEHGERLFNAAMERADSMKDEGSKPASETNKDKIQPTQPEPRAEDPEVAKAKSTIAIRDRAVEAYKNGYINETQRRMVEAALETDSHTHEEITKHLDDMVEKSAFNPKNAKAVIPNRREVLGAGAAAATVGVGPKAEAGVSSRDTFASLVKDPKASNTSILDHIAKIGTPLQKVQAAILRKLPGVDKILRDSATSDKEGKLDPKADPWVRGQLQDARGTAGLDPDNKHYILFNDSVDPRSDGMNPEVFLHEMFHAVLQQRYGMLEDYHPTSKTGRAADAAILEWKEKWKRIAEGLKQNVNLEEIGKTDEMAATGLSELMRSPDEAMSWLRTNENTRAFLDTIDLDGNVIPPQSPKLSVWDHIVDFVKKLLGIKDPTQVSALEELMKTSDQMLSHAQLDSPDLKEYMAQPGQGHDDAMRKSAQMFVGKDAAGSDKGKFAEAEIRRAAGQDAHFNSKVHDDTGVFSGQGGHLMREISDHLSSLGKLTDHSPGATYDLSDVLKHDALYKEYPWLKGVTVILGDEKTMNGARGAWHDNIKTIAVKAGMSEAQTRSVMLHEIQHAIQDHEGWSQGGNARSQHPTKAVLNSLASHYEEQLRQVHGQLAQILKDTNARNTKEVDFQRLKDAGYDAAQATRAMDTIRRAGELVEKSDHVDSFRHDTDYVEGLIKQTKSLREEQAKLDTVRNELKDKHAAAADTAKKAGDDAEQELHDLLARHRDEVTNGAIGARNNGGSNPALTPEAIESRTQQRKAAVQKVQDTTDALSALYSKHTVEHSEQVAKPQVDISNRRRIVNSGLDRAAAEMHRTGLGYDAYSLMGGEHQARVTQARADMDPATRRQFYPDTNDQYHQHNTTNAYDNLTAHAASEEEHEPVEHLTNAMNRPDNKPGELPKNPMARGAADVALNMNDTTRRGMLNLRTMEQLAERYKHLPMIKAIKDMLDVQARERDDLIRAGGIIHHLGRALPKDEQDKLSLVFDAERHQVDVLDPTARTNPDNSPEATDIHARFAALSPAAQDVYKQMIDAGKAKADTAKKIYAETINGMTNLDEGTKKRLISQMEAKFSRPVYFPHVWDGDFITIGKSDEFRKAEAAGDYDTMEKLRTDGNHYIVRASKTAADQRALIQALRGEGMDVNIKKREQFQPSTDIVPDKFMRVVNQGLDDHIRANPDMAEGLRGMKEMLNETRYAMMPDGSQLANKFKRKGVQGFETDALGVFARTTKRDADYLTKLKYNTGVRQELDNLSVKARENQSNADMDVSEQMRKHFNSLGKYHNSSASKILNNLTYAYYLGMSPSFMVMHLMQTPMITAPYLGARFDAAKVTAALGQAGAEGVANYRRLMQNEGNEQIFGKTADEKEALKYAATRGLFQATQAHSLMIDAAGGGKMDHIASAAMHVASFLPHHTERFNRLVTFQAAYRLAMAHPEVIPALDAETHAKATELTPGKFDLNPQQLAAARFAQDTVNTTHVDYSGHNAAHIMQPGVVPFGEVMFQFQKYQQGMLSILGDSLADLFSKKPAAEKWVAGKTLAGILTTHAAVTGLMGLPLVGTAVMLSNIYHKFFGDKDKPFDGDDALQKKMIDTFGPTWGEVALRGMLYAPGIKQIAPVDVTDRLGLGDVLAPTRQVGKINHDEWLKYIGSIAGGPSGSLLGQFADAYDYHEHGDDWKASEELMPKVMRDISRTIRFYNEGVTSKSGNEVISAEDMQKGPAFAQLAGFEPQNMQETYANRRAVQNAQAELQERRKVLLKEATDARTSGDQARLQRVMADIQRFNNVRSQEGTYSMRIKGGEIMRSFKTRQKNNASLDHGVALKHSQQDLGMYSLGEGSGDEQSSE